MAQLSIDNAFQLAMVHHQAGRLAAAETIYRQILSVAPNHANSLHLLGVMAGQMGRGDEAVQGIQQAIAARPDVATYHSNLGIALTTRGDFEPAIDSLRGAIALDPRFADARFHLGNVLRRVGRREEAVESYRRAIELRPGYAEAFNNLGNALREINRPAESIEPYQSAIALRPSDAEAHSNLGNAFREVGRLDEALAAYRKALALQPDLAVAHWNYGLALLLSGDLARGWAAYDWRRRVKGFPGLVRDYPRPIWNGSDPNGKTVLVHAEQGLGDMIQFCRYARLLADRGATVVLETQPELTRLMTGLPGVRHVIARGHEQPHFDLHIPVMNLPLAFGTTIRSIPAAVPYLHGEAKQIEIWRERLAGVADFKVGLVWAGRPEHQDDRSRSMSLSTLAPLAAVAGVQFYSLQKGPAGQQAASPPDEMRLTDLCDDLHDFADTAALIQLLDLVITVDTAVAHLAGALGKPVWVMLQFMPDWRWMMKRDDSPWYPTMKLFRQIKSGDWEEVVDRLALELHRRIIS